MANKKVITGSAMSKEFKVLGLITCIAQEFKGFINRELKSSTLNLTQLNILSALHSAPDDRLTVGEVKDAMVDDMPNISRTLNKLMDKGYVEKVRSATDQRVVHVHLTHEGHKALASVTLFHKKLQLNLPHEDIDDLYELLQIIDWTTSSNPSPSHQGK